MRQVANRYILLISTILSTHLIAVPSDAQFARSRSTRPSPNAATWFEGWYTRITPSDESSTIGLIVGSFRRLGTEGDQLPSGYVALIKQDQSGGLLEVHEAFPRHVQVQSAGWRKWPARFDTAFEWTSEGIGTVSDRSASITLPNGISFEAVFDARQPWNPTFPRKGPEGLAEQLRALRCHWSVYSVASQTWFKLSTPDRVHEGEGFAHQETNWGESFPLSYVWAQGSSTDGCETFVLSGGTIPWRETFREGYLLGIRTSAIQWDFKPQVPGTIFTTRIDARAGRIALCARAPFRLVEIDIHADPATFAPLAIPTSDGFLPGTLQSFSATATIRAYRVGLLGKALIGSCAGPRQLRT